MSNFKISAVVDITKDVCPMTYYKTKMKLSSLKSGEFLEVILKEGQPLKTVTTSLKDDGHKIVDVKKENDIFRLVVEKG